MGIEGYGVIRFHGWALSAKTRANAAKLTPDDFRSGSRRLNRENRKHIPCAECQWRHAECGCYQIVTDRAVEIHDSAGTVTSVPK